MNSAVSPNPNGERIVRHGDYYIHGGDVIFRVENYLFRVHRFFFTRDSAFFRDKLPHPPPPGEFTKGSSDNNPFILEDTLLVDFERFLWIFYNPKYSIYHASIEEWTSILKLAHQWDFVEAKALALRELQKLEIPALQKIIIYQTHAIDRNLLQEAYTTLTLRDEPITIEEGRELGLETALQLARAREIARAPVFSGKKSGASRPSPINLAGVELDALIQGLFQLSSPSGVHERPSTPPTPTGRGTPTGGRNTPQLGIQTNGTGFSVSNSYRGGSVMNAYPPISSHADLPVQVRVVPPTGTPMATQTERPMATATPVTAASRVAPIPPPTQEAGLMKREGAERVSELQNKPEPRGKEVDLKARQSEPAATSAATDTIKAKDAVQAQGAASNPKGVVENNKGQGPVRKTETAEQGSGKARQERARTQSEHLATATMSTLDPPSDRPRSHTAELTKKEQLKIVTTVSGSEPPKHETIPRPTPVPASATASTSTAVTQTQRTIQHKKQSASTPATTSSLFGFMSIFGSGGDAGYESSSRESEDDAPMAGGWHSRDNKARQEREKAEAEAKARTQAQEETRRRLEAEAAKARAEAEENARREAEDKACKEAEDKARKEAEDKARKEAEDKASKEAEEKARKEREEAARAKEKTDAEAKKAAAEAKKADKAKREADAKAKREADAKAKREADAKAKREADAKAKREADAKAKREADAKAKREADAKARKEQEEAARAQEKAAAEAKEAEATAMAEAAAKVKAEVEAQQAKLEAEEKAKADAEARAKAEAEATEAMAQKAKLEADAEAKAEEDAKVKREAEAEATAKVEAVAKAKREAEAKAKTEEEAEAKAEEEAEAKAKAEAEASDKREADARAKAEAEAHEKAEAEAKEKRETAAKAKEEADAKAAEEAKVKAAEAKAAAAKAESEARQRAEKERLEAEAKSKADAAKVRAKAEEERKRVEAEKAEEQIARQRAADKAARAAHASAPSPMSPARASGGSSWFSKIASAIIPTEEPAPPPKSASPWNSDPWSKRHGKNVSSPGTEPSHLRSPGGPGALVQHSPTTSSNPRGSVPTHSATSLKAAQSSTSVVSSSPTLVSQEHKPINDKQDGKAGDGKGNQATAAQPAEAATDVPDKTKGKTAMATPDKTVTSKTTDAGKTSDAAGGATVPDASGDKAADSSALSSIKAGSTQAQKEEVVANSEHNKDPVSASTATAAPADATPAPPVPKKDPPPENDATVTKQHTPTSEPAASASAKPNGEPEAPNAPDPDAKKASETSAQTEAPPATQGNGAKPGVASTEPAPQPSQNGKAGDEKPTSTKGDDAKSGGSGKPALRLDRIREVSTASTMSASSPGTPGDEAPSSSLEKDDDVDASGARLTKAQKKRIREKARKQAQKGEKNSPRPPSGATSNGVDNSVVQEPEPVATAPVDIPVDIPVGEGEGVLVDVKTESGEDDAPVIVEKPDAAASTAETASDDTAGDDEWDW